MKIEAFKLTDKGIVELFSSLDRETQSIYQIPIVARSDKSIDVTTLKIVVLDVNDNKPAFIMETCNAIAILENQEYYKTHRIKAGLLS